MTSAGQNRDSLRPSTNGDGGADCELGNGGGSEEKKLKKKWGRKRWNGFGQGMLERTGARGAGGCRFEMDGAVR
jgi:hypothetical protein